MTTATRSGDSYTDEGRPARSTSRRLSTETKAAFKTTELIAYVAAVVGTVIVATLVKKAGGHDDYFRADKAMFYIVLLTIGYLGSRGLAKAGSHENYDDHGDRF